MEGGVEGGMTVVQGGREGDSGWGKWTKRIEGGKRRGKLVDERW